LYNILIYCKIKLRGVTLLAPDKEGYMAKILSFLHVNGRLLLQFLIVFVAFFVMVFVSNFYNFRIVNRNMESYGEKVVSVSAEAINSYLSNFSVTLENLSFSIERLQENNAGVNAMQRELELWTKMIHEKTGDSNDSVVFYGFINGTFMDGFGSVPDADFVPQSRPWYTGAVAKNGEIYFSEQYRDLRLGIFNLSISKMLFDKNGNPFGVIATNILISGIANYVDNMDYLGFGYGVLLDSQQRFVIHPNADLIGIYLKDVNEGQGGYMELSDHLFDNGFTNAHRFDSYSYVDSIAFYRQLDSGWYIGIVLSRDTYFFDIRTMQVIMISVGFILAALLCCVLAYMHIRVNISDEASKVKSSFLATMSHEIRTPMNSIMGFTELALDDETSPKTRDYLTKIQTNSEWLLQIINDILDISKIESGKMELERIPFDMHELFSSCRALVMPKAVEKGILLHFYAEPSVGKKPLGDPTRLRQVFVNLISNAIKFTNVGMVKVQSEIIKTTENSATMAFVIKDSGIGMTPEQIERVFDSFTQAESGTMRKYGGTGLGLAISRTIVEMMGGHLVVESSPGVGSKFSFELTFETIDYTQEELEKKKSYLNDISKPTLEGEVLICEDNEMNQFVIVEHLARVGLKAVVAENGRIGVDIVKDRIRKGERLFDLIFMDIHMPVMDGFEAADEINKLNINIPMVAMTANVMNEDMDVYKLSGIPDCVGKPFTSQELWRCLLKYFTPK